LRLGIEAMGLKMKKLLALLPVLVVMFCIQPALAQTADAGSAEDKPEAMSKEKRAEMNSRAAIDKLMKYVQARNYTAIGKMTVYAGRDPNRMLRTKVNMLDPHEKLEVENTTNYMHHVLEKSVIWNATNFKMVSSVQDHYYYWDLEFTNEKMKTMVYTVFMVELKGEFLFARFDKKGALK
jgi:hypothetical protein